MPILIIPYSYYIALFLLLCLGIFASTLVCPEVVATLRGLGTFF